MRTGSRQGQDAGPRGRIRGIIILSKFKPRPRPAAPSTQQQPQLFHFQISVTPVVYSIRRNVLSYYVTSLGRSAESGSPRTRAPAVRGGTHAPASAGRPRIASSQEIALHAHMQQAVLLAQANEACGTTSCAANASRSPLLRDLRLPEDAASSSWDAVHRLASHHASHSAFSGATRSLLPTQTAVRCAHRRLVSASLAFIGQLASV